MVLSLPDNFPVKSSHFGLQHNTSQFTSPLSRINQRVEYPGARWMGTYNLSTSKRDEAAAVQAMMIKLRGAANTFYGYDPTAMTPRGVGTGTPLVNGAGQTGTSLISNGWTPNVTGILLAGDYISVNNELKMLTQDADSDGTGSATLRFEPPFRYSPGDNASITVNKASCIMRLVDDDQTTWDVDEAGFYSMSFSVVECFF